MIEWRQRGEKRKIQEERRRERGRGEVQRGRDRGKETDRGGKRPRYSGGEGGEKRGDI